VSFSSVDVAFLYYRSLSSRFKIAYLELLPPSNFTRRLLPCSNPKPTWSRCGRQSLFCFRLCSCYIRPATLSPPPFFFSMELGILEPSLAGHSGLSSTYSRKQVDILRSLSLGQQCLDARHTSTVATLDLPFFFPAHGVWPNFLCVWVYHHP